MTEVEQLRADLIYLARRQRAIEDELTEWSDYLTQEILRQALDTIKDREGLGKFKGYLSQKFKSDYDKLEGLFSKVNLILGKKAKDKEIKGTYH